MFLTSFINGLMRTLLLSVLVIFFYIPEQTFAAGASVDHARITVYYTEAVAAAAPFFSWWSLPLMLAGCGWVLWKEGYFGNEPQQAH